VVDSGYRYCLGFYDRLLFAGFQNIFPNSLRLYGLVKPQNRIYGSKKAGGSDSVFSQHLRVSKTGNLPGLPLTDLSVMRSGSITTRTFFEEASRRYQGTRLCCVGDIGESLEEPLKYSVHTLWEMQILGMNPAKENWDNWTINVRDERSRKWSWS
jgi:hypothetical protein